MSIPSKRLRLSSPADLLSAVPYLIGYRPADSILCIAVSRGRAVFYANTFLSQIAVDVPGEVAAAAADIAARTAAEGDTAVVVGYGTSDQVDAVVAQFHSALAAIGVSVQVVLRSLEDRYFCLDPYCGGSCPPDGTGYDAVASSVAVQLVVDGHTALPSRAAMVALLDPVGGARRDEMDAACRSASRRMRAMLPDADRSAGTDERVPRVAPQHVVDAGMAALHDALDAAAHGRVLSDDEVGWLAIALLVPAVKVAALQRSTGDAAQQQLWTDVVRRATPSLTVVPAVLLASTAYHTGNAVLARIAVDRALQIEPGDGFAQIIDLALQGGVRPPAWRAALQAATS
ncbi:DUF4192 domain-containing protein [Dactylosporangium sp. NPDC005555]|uniref:DUF4192 domain-containing protein n=1 Tax=Dactylosporangium sp. NPDC005555 TaxID=3154889 RepID=UPI0033A60CFC